MSEQVDCAVIGAGVDDLQLLSSDELAEMESNVRAEAMSIRCRTVINTSGLKAPAVAASIRSGRAGAGFRVLRTPEPRHTRPAQAVWHRSTGFDVLTCNR